MNNDSISREALKKTIEDEATFIDGDSVYKIINIIDNAPIVDPLPQWQIEFLSALIEKTKGECRTCRHRDPEDKKCDCGAQERQGCQFPVRDNYYCKFYEKGGAE